MLIRPEKNDNHLSFENPAMTLNEKMVITRKIENHFASVFSDACKFAFYAHAYMHVHPAPSLQRPIKCVMERGSEAETGF